MNLRGHATQNYFPAMQAIDAPKPVARGPDEAHRQSQGEHYAERPIHAPGGSVANTPVLSFVMDLADLFAV